MATYLVQNSTCTIIMTHKSLYTQSILLLSYFVTNSQNSIYTFTIILCIQFTKFNLALSLSYFVSNSQNSICTFTITFYAQFKSQFVFSLSPFVFNSQNSMCTFTIALCMLVQNSTYISVVILCYVKHCQKSIYIYFLK